jgi:hypothetical protein
MSTTDTTQVAAEISPDSIVPAPDWTPDVAEPLSDEEMREMLTKVRELHAAFEHIRDNGPAMLQAVAESNPMLKMMGRMFGA